VRDHCEWQNKAVYGQALVWQRRDRQSFSAAGACSKSRAPPAPQGYSRHRPRTWSADDYNGWLEAGERLRSRAQPYRQDWLSDGQIVNKGDLLFQLDPRPFEAEVGRSRDELRVVEAQKVAADRDYERMKQLVGEGAVSKTEADKSEARALSLAAQVEAARQEITRRELDVEYARITHGSATNSTGAADGPQSGNRQR
jgi:hypothetical protein